METKETIMLHQEIAALRERVALLETDLATAKAQASYDHGDLLRYMSASLDQLHLVIYPTFNKLFPNFAKASERVDEVIGWKPASSRHSYGKDRTGREIL